ncbi:hypothetical protein DL762_003748 [Monosporascus cannonballus]|uniref:Cytochrome P450 n=1 Tax=Monosporascus cannonballus TaxID=155416 RepID=A0ABY0H9R2_9PEZI|nr:hypothetical protein DL762_003748 [Monosporascus cannonballus]
MTNLTFDITWGVVMDLELGAQNLESSDRNEFIRVFRDLIYSYPSEQMNLPSWLVSRTTWKRNRLTKRVKSILKHTIINKYDKLQKEGDIRSRSILSLSLQDVNPLTPEVVEETCDQISTFLFSGHDTTSILLSWVFYELSRTPHALSAVRAELDKLFGPDPSPSEVRARLLSGHAEELLNRMTYTAAVIKETLRLWPPGGTGRMTKPGTGLTVQTPTGEYCLDGMLIYNCASIIMRDPSVYGDTADVFVPERWLQDAAKIPAGAWRPFERGPRNCIGQELANIEARVIIALVARRYDFIKLGTGEPIMGKNGQCKVVSEMYSVSCVMAMPKTVYCISG